VPVVMMVLAPRPRRAGLRSWWLLRSLAAGVGPIRLVAVGDEVRVGVGDASGVSVSAGVEVGSSVSVSGGSVAIMTTTCGAATVTGRRTNQRRWRARRRRR
jgi:hypothetical protein